VREATLLVLGTGHYRIPGDNYPFVLTFDENADVAGSVPRGSYGGNVWAELDLTSGWDLGEGSHCRKSGFYLLGAVKFTGELGFALAEDELSVPQRKDARHMIVMGVGADDQVDIVRVDVEATKGKIEHSIEADVMVAWVHEDRSLAPDEGRSRHRQEPKIRVKEGLALRIDPEHQFHPIELHLGASCDLVDDLVLVQGETQTEGLDKHVDARARHADTFLVAASIQSSAGSGMKP
jgi:hypothetical protein